MRSAITKLLSLTFMAFLITLAGISTPSAHAVWPLGSNSDLKTDNVSEPPPADYKATHCDPLKAKIVELNKIQPSFVHFFARPRIGLLKERHYRCLKDLASREREYLNSVQLEGTAPPPDSENETTNHKKR